MKTCIKCKLSGDDASFYPNNKVCKPCVGKIQVGRDAGQRDHADRVEREQYAILDIVKGLQKDIPSFVYLVEVESGYKIGFSTDVNKRIRSLNTGHKIPCRLIAVAPGGRQLEKSIHERFASSRISREWFSHRLVILQAFTALPGVYVFLPGYMTAESKSPLDVSSSPTS